MARTAYPVRPPPRPADASLGQPTPIVPATYTLIDGDRVCVQELAGDGSELLMMPTGYDDRDDVAEDAAEWRNSLEGDGDIQDARRCWSTTAIYQHLEHHPKVVRFLRSDPWTWLPVIQNPGGPNLRDFLKANRHEMYDQRVSHEPDRSTACARAKATRFNLVYQWALQLARALEFIHSHSFEPPVPRISIIFGDLRVESCWLSSSGKSLSLLGFLNSGWRARSTPLRVSNLRCHGPFKPLPQYATMQTDLFLWGCVVYEMMTNYWPGEGQGLSQQDQMLMVSCREWPRLESIYLGDVVRKCWTEEITSAVNLLSAVRKAITDLGIVIGEDDEIADLNLEGLTTELFAEPGGQFARPRERGVPTSS